MAIVPDVRRFLSALRRRPDGVVLALCGGGARGLAHVGVLSVLERERIPVAGIAGTSAGALVGAMWLALGSAEAVEARWREILVSGVLPGDLPNVRFRPSVETSSNLLMQLARRLQRGAALAMALERRCLLPAEDVNRVLDFLVPDVEIEDLPVPFAAVATNYETGRPVALRRGSLRLALCASTAVPGAMAPVSVDGLSLIDGGVVADVPVLQARELAPVPVVAIDTGETLPGGAAQSITVPTVMVRANLMTHRALRETMLAAADLVVRPDVGVIHWSEFSRLDESIAGGRAAAQAAAAAIASLAGGRARATPPVPATGPTVQPVG
jgi:NTE family protein